MDELDDLAFQPLSDDTVMAIASAMGVPTRAFSDVSVTLSVSDALLLWAILEAVKRTPAHPLPAPTGENGGA